MTFESIIKQKFSKNKKEILQEYQRIKSSCLTEDARKCLLEGEEIIKTITPLELDADMFFAGLITPLIRANLFDFDAFKNLENSISLANSTITIENLATTNSGKDNLVNMLVAMAKDIRVVVLKLADVLNNARNIGKIENLSAFVELTENLYAPLASRLGLSFIKSELQDIILSIKEPEEYANLEKILSQNKKEREAQIEEAMSFAKSVLTSLNINGKVYGRLKHISSVYNKIHNKNHKLEQMYDLSAVRVIVSTVNECYAVLGAIHTKFIPMAGRFKDYIAKPKENGYQSLHTCVFIDDSPLEFQVRTNDMHNHAEYGIAAHFLYKERKNKFNTLDEKLLWIKKAIENSNPDNSEEVINQLKTDVYDDEIFVQTPQGKIIQLPTRSTPLDFAYAIHSNIGNKCVGAKVNGKMVPVNSVLNNADTVEIITNANSKGPSRDWLNIVKTASAKNKINQYFKKEMREENIKKGKSILEQNAKTKGIDLTDYLIDDVLNVLFAKYALKSVDDMYANIGSNSITSAQILTRLVAIYDELNSKPKDFVVRTNHVDLSQNKCQIKELNGILIKFAQCCMPVYGDNILGFVSRGHGVTIHKHDCQTLNALDKNRLMQLTWSDEDNKSTYVGSIKLLVKDTPGIFANIASKIAEQQINIININTQNAKEDMRVIEFKVSIQNKQKLENLMLKLKNIEGVYEVFRPTGDKN